MATPRSPLDGSKPRIEWVTGCSLYSMCRRREACRHGETAALEEASALRARPGSATVRFVRLSHQGDLTMATGQPAGPAVEPGGTALGITAAAGLILMLVGVFGMIQGIVGLLDNDLYVVTNKWLFELTATALGLGTHPDRPRRVVRGPRVVLRPGLGEGHRDHRRGV